MRNLTEFNPNNLVKKLSDKIKESFADLIPDEKWDEMVKKEVDAFFTEEATTLVLDEREEGNDYWNRKTVKQIKLGEGITPFRAIVWNLCIEETYKVTQGEVFKTYLKSQWAYKEEDMNENMKEIVKECIPYAINRYFEQVAMSSAALTLQEELNRLPQQY